MDGRTMSALGRRSFFGVTVNNQVRKFI